MADAVSQEKSDGIIPLPGNFGNCTSAYYLGLVASSSQPHQSCKSQQECIRIAILQHIIEYYFIECLSHLLQCPLVIYIPYAIQTMTVGKISDL